MSSPTTVPPILPQGTGYGICVGLGALFGLTMWYITKILAKYLREVQTSEMFMTAKRSINTGLIASAVVSSWTIAATLLTSLTWTYSYGVSSAYFCAGACIQIFLFSVAAIELKRKAPGAHTILELTKIRYGAPGHCIQIFYSTLVQLFNCVNLLVGGSAVFKSITGMDVIAGCFLLPIGVVIYTLTGGILLTNITPLVKATFLVDYTHTVIIYVIILVSLFTAYTNSELIGSADAMYDLLRNAAQSVPVSGNSHGEYLTIQSLDSVVLGIVIFTTAWSAVVDVQLFQKAIAANPANTMGGYMLGGLCWFSIPFCLSITFGLVARALQNSPAFPTYPRAMTVDEINAGLVLPYAAQGGAAAVLLMMFMAVTSAFSSELVCLASVTTYDIYRTYFNGGATGAQLLRLSHFVVVIFSVCCACIAAGLSQTKIGVNFIVTSVGIVCAPGIFPLAATVLWRKQNTIAVVLAPLLGTATGIACWIGSTQHWYNEITIATLGEAYPLVVGNTTALFSPMFYSPLLTYIFGPQDFKWSKFRENIHVVDDSDVVGISASQLAEQQKENELTSSENSSMKRARRTATIASILVTLAFIIVFPMPLYGTGYVFSRDFFRFWVVWTFLWAWAAALIITLLPLWQGRHTLAHLSKLLIGRADPDDVLSRTSSVAEEVAVRVDFERKSKSDENL